MSITLSFDTECSACNGTGLYIGLAERSGAAVVCKKCKGTGCHVHSFEYIPFEGKKEPNKEIKRVYQTNPGIVIGTIDGLIKLEDFGGISVEEWQSGKEFSPGTEDRKHTCPCWFYQNADYNKKPNWKECNSFNGSFSSCKLFCCKKMCWERWDKEYNK